MSLKSTRRSRRRTDDDIDDFKLPTNTLPKRDINKSDLQDNVHKNGIDDESGNLKGFISKEGNESDTSDNAGPKTRSRSNTPQNKKDMKNNGDANESVNDKEEDRNVDNEIIAEIIIPLVRMENGNADKAEMENSDKIENEKSENVKKLDNELENVEEMEALVVNVDEPESELEFADNSETESHKDSPNSLRCKTRRSQTRNIPTPKTPKSIVIDLEEEKKEEEEIVINLVDTVSSSPENIAESLPDEEDDDCQVVTTDTQDSLENLSTKVHIPYDETTFSEEQTDENSFLNMAKEKTFAEVLRRTSSRRPIHSLSYNTWDNSGNALLNRSRLSLRPSVERIPGLKRKNSNELSDNTKRSRTDNNGFLSYISSPISNLKNKFTKPDVPSSTPKLTSYKDRIFESDDVGKIDIDVDLGDPTTEKKWCVIM